MIPRRGRHDLGGRHRESAPRWRSHVGHLRDIEALLGSRDATDIRTGKTATDEEQHAVFTATRTARHAARPTGNDKGDPE